MGNIYTVVWFIVGICFGSFYHVIGYRIPKNETLTKPKHSYCPECGKKLSTVDLIPVFSFLFARGKCRYCQKKIPLLYPITELITGVLFAMSFHIFNYSYEFLIALVFSSLFSIILVSDILYYIIPDIVTIIASIILIILSIIAEGVEITLLKIQDGIFISYGMYLFMKISSFIFKKETLGGADIKLMFLSGFCLGPIVSLCTIFFSSVMALPFAIFSNLIKKEELLPYGPFIVLTIFLLLIFKVDNEMIFQLLIPTI